MKDNIFIKGITLVLFISMITGFVAYKAGYFDAPKSDSIKANALSFNNPSDSIPEIDSIRKVLLMSSSKSMIIRDHSRIIKDTTKNPPDSNLNINPVFIPSSKSGPIFDAKDLIKIQTDSIVNDSIKQ